MDNEEVPFDELHEQYGMLWRPRTSKIEREIHCIQMGGQWQDDDGKIVGLGLFEHYRNLQSFLWADDDHHRWSDLLLQTFLDNRHSVVMGSKDCGKTHTMAKFALTDYFCFPNTTLTLMTSTEVRGLQLRVWGEIKDLFNRARSVWPEAPGNSLEKDCAIFTEGLLNGEPRDWRKGLICVPLRDENNQWTGLTKFTGIKQKRRRLISDELQFANQAFIATLANLDKGDFKFIGAGNPIGEGDPLDKMAEPVEGWDNLGDITTTTSWKNRMGGTTVNLVGTDSPGIVESEKYPYLINQSDIDRIANYWGKDSSEYFNQALGTRKRGISERRIVTRDMCIQFGAQEPVMWRGTPVTKVYAVDAAYGGDRCIGGEAGFGLDINGKLVIALGTPRLIPIKMFNKSTPEEERLLPEDQIAEYVKADCERLEIPPRNVGHDATGRGSLGTSFARIWSAETQPIEFGGAPTQRPVSADMYIYDEKLRIRRLKRCDEHYVKFVSELHYSVRYVIEAGQMRGLPTEVMDELCRREWDRVKGYRIEVETKDKYKERYGRSPDLADWCAIVVEIARRLGFQIAKLDDQRPKQADGKNDRWKEDLREQVRRERRQHSLIYTA